MHVVINTGYKLMLKNVTHILELMTNLLSTRVFEGDDYKSHFMPCVWKLVTNPI